MVSLACPALADLGVARGAGLELKRNLLKLGDQTAADLPAEQAAWDACRVSYVTVVGYILGVWSDGVYTFTCTHIHARARTERDM